MRVIPFLITLLLFVASALLMIMHTGTEKEFAAIVTGSGLALVAPLMGWLAHVLLEAGDMYLSYTNHYTNQSSARMNRCNKM